MAARAWCTCGWHGTYTSRARADYAASMHSCARWEAKRARARAKAERLRASDRTPKPCLHPVAQHQHGTYAAYKLDGCPCVPCTAANTEYNRQRERDLAYGRSRMVDAGPARAHVHALMDARVGLKTIAARSGVSHGCLSKLIYGTKAAGGGHRAPSARIDKATAAKLLALRADLDTVAGGARVPAVGVVRRVQALATLGWSVQQVAERAGVDRQVLDAVLAGDREQVTAATARAIREVYERLWDVPPPQDSPHQRAAVTRVRNRAAEHGWPPPAAWDDDALDDPAAGPAEAPDTDDTSGTAGRLDEWLHLVVRVGEDPTRAARRVGWDGRDGLEALRAWARRNGRAGDVEQAVRLSRSRMTLAA